MDAVIVSAGIDTVIKNDTVPQAGLRVLSAAVRSRPRIPAARTLRHDTEWVLFTSGTTGAPKLVAHSLPGLMGAIHPSQGDAVWSTFYDVRRYGGLQILLRGLLGGGSMVLSNANESVAAFLTRAGASGVTHISGTPSHWRRVLMSGHAHAMAPQYVRLSGEIADQALLDRLRDIYPAARVSHAFASTEAGVAFDVTDGLAGFPAAWANGNALPGIELRVADGTLRIRSTRTATRYIGTARLHDGEGFVDTGDIVTLEEGRYHFRGRMGGIINVGGQKVHPEEVEAALTSHPAVLAARVRAQANPIMGAIVAADVVVRDAASQQDGLRQEILEASRARLAPHKVPALLRFVAALDMLPSGKMARLA